MRPNSLRKEYILVHLLIPASMIYIIDNEGEKRLRN
jgi:hypothetical protein